MLQGCSGTACPQAGDGDGRARAAAGPASCPADSAPPQGATGATQRVPKWDEPCLSRPTPSGSGRGAAAGLCFLRGGSARTPGVTRGKEPGAAGSPNSGETGTEGVYPTPTPRVLHIPAGHAAPERFPSRSTGSGVRAAAEPGPAALPSRGQDTNPINHPRPATSRCPEPQRSLHKRGSRLSSGRAPPSSPGHRRARGNRTQPLQGAGHLHNPKSQPPSHVVPYTSSPAAAHSVGVRALLLVPDGPRPTQDMQPPGKAWAKWDETELSVSQPRCLAHCCLQHIPTGHNGVLDLHPIHHNPCTPQTSCTLCTASHAPHTPHPVHYSIPCTPHTPHTPMHPTGCLHPCPLEQPRRVPPHTP